MTKPIVIINGPNLNLLGERETDKYGRQTLEQMNGEIREFAAQIGVDTIFYQSNSEGEIVDLLHRHRRGLTGIIINAAGYSHTSVAILDALATVEVPIVEVHLTNIYKREEFRHVSLTARAAEGVITGFGKAGYLLAIRYLVERTHPAASP